MADNFLITGYHGTPHVTAENDRGIYSGIVGAGRFVLPTGNRFRAEHVGNNVIRVYDGKLIDNGAAAGIPAGEYVDLLIPNAGQGMKRNDLIVFQYEKDAATLVETGSFVLLLGEETSGTPADPALQQEDLLSGVADFDQMPLWRLTINGVTIGSPVQMFAVSNCLSDASVPLSGATMQGALIADGTSSADLTVAQMRNMVFTTIDPGKGTASSYPDGTVVGVLG